MEYCINSLFKFDFFCVQNELSTLACPELFLLNTVPNNPFPGLKYRRILYCYCNFCAQFKCKNKNVYYKNYHRFDFPRMSMYFFRLHNLRRAAEEDKKKKLQQQKQKQQRRSTNRRQHRYTGNSALTLAPSRLFERQPLTPSDSLDEVALQIPRCFIYVNTSWYMFRVVFSFSSLFLCFLCSEGDQVV